MATSRIAPKKVEDIVPAAQLPEQDFYEQVRARAYELFERRGGEPGHDLEDWLRAETELLVEKRQKAA